ncbi:MAG: acetate--CoA ligase family protein, partial [Casimicrobiaceae bacterium]
RAMTADHLEQHGVPLATFAPATVEALTAALPGFGGVENPTDLTGQVLSQPKLFDECLAVIASDPYTEALIVQVANRGPRDVVERAALLTDVANRIAAPVVVSFLGDALPLAERAPLFAASVLCARDPAEAARYLGWLYRARSFAARPPFACIRSAPAESPATWADSTRYLAQCGIGVPRSCVVGPREDARAVCSGLRYPVVVKALPEDCDHKTEIGAVFLRMPDSNAAAHAVAKVRERLDKPDASVLVQEMIDGGVEVLLSALRNPDFGPVLAIGMGGTAVELFRDVAYLALPTSVERVQHALSRLRVAKLLGGFRGRPPADGEALAEAAVRFGGQFAQSTANVLEIEINPLFVLPKGQGVVAVDTLVRRL